MRRCWVGYGKTKYPVCTENLIRENLIRVDDVMESPKLAE